MSEQTPNLVLDADRLLAWLHETTALGLAHFDELDDDELFGPELEIVNPPIWEFGHVGWFHEKWVLRHYAGRAPLREDGDALYDSSEVHHPTRWRSTFPPREATRDYVREVVERACEVLADNPNDPDALYFGHLGLFHADMHNEAFAYTRQTLAQRAPAWIRERLNDDLGPMDHTYRGDVAIAGGTYRIGAERDEPFVFDNEKWAHDVHLEPFRIARCATTQGEFLAFVEEGGYEREDLWSAAGWAWRVEAGARQPVYWRRGDGGWERRRFDRWIGLEHGLPMVHANWYEAEAFCNWAGRRLPTEAEWEVAASFERSRKRRFPWGEDAPSAEHANLDYSHAGARPVCQLAGGDTEGGCRQMIGNVWEWTSTDFAPYPGFVPDPYADYSQPWFYDHKVLRGGCWATRGRMLRNTWRNYYKPHRRDVWCGFRTCAR